MNVMLLNPNRYHIPPVPPIGLEYLMTPLLQNGHTVFITDLCFSTDVYQDVQNAIKEHKPNLIGITIRNIDTSQYPHTEFFLEEIKQIIAFIKRYYELPVVIGGAGYSALPENVLRFLQADYGISGPGEGALPALVNKLEQGAFSPPLINGWNFPVNPELFHKRGIGLDYKKYRENSGSAGFETQKGCTASCIYCLEANRPHLKRSLYPIIAEIRSLRESGNDNFHLCDSEFNIDLSYSTTFCEALISEAVSIRWSLYMKPEPVSEKIFTLLKTSGADLITLTVNSYELPLPGYRNSVAQCIDCARKNGLTLVVDLLMGFPFESVDALRSTIDFFRIHRPNSVGVNYSIRIIPNTPLYNYFMKNHDKRSSLIAVHKGDNEFLYPVLYQHSNSSQIPDWISNDSLFRIEGTEGGTNYQRFQKNLPTD